MNHLSLLLGGKGVVVADAVAVGSVVVVVVVVVDSVADDEVVVERLFLNH